MFFLMFIFVIFNQHINDIKNRPIKKTIMIVFIFLVMD